MLNTEFSPWPSFDSEEIKAVGDVLQSNRVNYWTGEQGKLFEQEFANWSDSAHAIALANGTVALDLAFRALGIGEGHEVIVTPRTFLASVSSIVNCGARPVFADVSLDSQNITAESVESVLTEKTRAIVCVHLAGWPCEMDDLKELAQSRDIKIIEDCAQAHGAEYRGTSVGSIGDIGAWSFCQDKIMTTGGEGGMVTTNDKELWLDMWSFKDHGKSWTSVFEKQHPPGFRWLHDSFGTNWRITEMQSAIGRLQLQKMPEWREHRLTNANRIWSTARELKGLRVPDIPEHIVHGAYKCYVFIEPGELKQGWTRDRIMNEITEQGVPAYSGSCSEVYLEKAFETSELRPQERLPNARELGDTSLMFLVHPTLTELEIDKTCEVLARTMRLATS